MHLTDDHEHISMYVIVFEMKLQFCESKRVLQYKVWAKVLNFPLFGIIFLFLKRPSPTKPFF